MRHDNRDQIKKRILNTGGATPLLITTPYQSPLDELVDWVRGELPAGHVVEPGESGPITVKQARQIVQQTNHTALTGQGSLVVLLANAERLSLPAANTLLKSLEESNAAWQFILTTRWPGRLPATIRSRAEHYRLTVSRVPEMNSDSEAWPASLAERLAEWSTKGGIDEEKLSSISQALAGKLRQQGPSKELTTAYQRLRDYHKLSQVPGDNRTIGEVLLASLPEPMAR